MISIITGTLNRLELLKHIIENTVNQSDKLELILLDGGSTDGTIEYIKGLNNPQINLIEIGGRSSYPSFMNTGIKAAKYDWICQWNDDVLLINNWDDVFKLIEQNKDVYIFDWNRGSIDEFRNKKFDNWIWFWDCMNFGLYRKDIFRNIGMYDSKFAYYECDHDMTTRCWYFGYQVENCHDIKVFEILTEKRSLNYDNDRMLWVQNKYIYEQKILPNTIEKLINLTDEKDTSKLTGPL